MNGRDYLTLLRESKILIAGCVAACLVLGGLVTLLMPKTYESSVTYYVTASGPYWGNQLAASESLQGATLAENRVKSYMELVTGHAVAERAANALGDTTADDVRSSVSAETVGGTVVFTMTVKERTSVRAVAVASAVTQAFGQLVDDLETPSVVTQQVPAVTADTIEGPTQPTAPTTPRLDLNLVIALVVGLLLGFGAAIVRRSLDRSVSSVQVLSQATSAPVLGVVRKDRSVLEDPVLTLSRPANIRGAAVLRAEAYRRLRTVVESIFSDDAPRVLVVTSPLRGDGRSVTACNLASAFAAAGRRVVLVDADLRTPKVEDYLGFESAPGLTDVLADGIEVGRAVQHWTIGSFDVLLSGQVSAQPNEMLSSRLAGQLIAELRTRYDVVVIDSPPILPFADAANIGAYADGAILVCRWGRTMSDDVRAAAAFLRSVSIPVLGSVLSAVPEKVAVRAALDASSGVAVSSGAAAPSREAAPRPRIDEVARTAAPPRKPVPPLPVSPPPGPAPSGSQPRPSGAGERNGASRPASRPVPAPPRREPAAAVPKGPAPANPAPANPAPTGATAGTTDGRPSLDLATVRINGLSAQVPGSEDAEEKP